MAPGSPSPTRSSTAGLSHEALIEKARQQRRQLQESTMPGTPATPVSVQAVPGIVYGSTFRLTSEVEQVLCCSASVQKALAFETPPEDSPKYRGLAARWASGLFATGGSPPSAAFQTPIATTQLRSPSSQPSTAARPSPGSATRSGSVPGSMDRTRKLQAEMKFDELARQLVSTKDALQQSEERAGRMLGMSPLSSPSKPSPEPVRSVIAQAVATGSPGASPTCTQLLSPSLKIASSATGGRVPCPGRQGSIRTAFSATGIPKKTNAVLQDQLMQAEKRLRLASLRLHDKQQCLRDWEQKAERAQQAIAKMTLSTGTRDARGESRMLREVDVLHANACKLLWGSSEPAPISGRREDAHLDSVAADAIIQAQSVAVLREQRLEELRNDLAQQSQKLHDTEREIAQLRLEREHMQMSVHESKNVLRRVLSEEASSEEKRAAVRNSIAEHKQKNSVLKKAIHKLEHELQGVTSTQARQGQILREAQAQRERDEMALRCELNETTARLEDAVSQIGALKLDVQHGELRRRDLEFALADRQVELETTLTEQVNLKQDFLERLEHSRQLHKDRMSKMKWDHRTEKLQNECDLSSWQAQLKAFKLRCNDEHRTAALMEQQLEERRRGCSESELSRKKLAQEFAELSDLLQVERARFAAELRAVEAGAEKQQQLLRFELEEAQNQCNALQDLAAVQGLQLRGAHAELGRVERQKDETESKRRVVQDAFPRSKVIMEQLEAQLAEARRRHEATVREIAQLRFASEETRGRSIRQALLLKGEVEDAQRSATDLGLSLEANERQAIATEARLRACINETQGNADETYRALEAEHRELMNRVRFQEQENQDLEWKAKDLERREEQMNTSYQAKVESLNAELAHDRTMSSSLLTADIRRSEQMRGANTRLQSHCAEVSSMRHALDALHASLQEHAKSVGRRRGASVTDT